MFESSLPLLSATARIVLEEESRNTTHLAMTLSFSPKFGVLGRLMIPVMKPRFKRMLVRVLEANAAYVEGRLKADAA